MGNAVITRLLKAGLAPRSYVLLTVVGRRTGKPHTTPVRVLEYEGARWLVAPYGAVSWVRNARAAGEVVLTRGRTRQQLSVTESDPRDSAGVLREYVRREPVTRPYFDATVADPVDRFAEEADRHPVFRLVED
nr:hypothetical protein [Kibdelosporangium sp. MJ126-NF4]CTQ98885.1 hypothetical protein [Kibdelosporangium sp. MJ126-NF4]